MKSFWQLYDDLNKVKGMRSISDDFPGMSQGGLKELTPDDMSQTSEEDHIADIERKRKLGWNPTKLGEPMSDEDFNKFHGLE